MHINLWLYQGNPPSNGQEVEVIVKDADLPPALGINRINQIPNLDFSLSQNYPNPVVSRTVIKYSIASLCKVELKLFDVTGRQVAVLVNENQKPGYYQVNWNIRNVSEKQLPNGVYFYRLTAGNWINTKKLVIVR